MLSDESIKPICERYARIFAKQAEAARHIGPGAYNEMYAQAYVVAKNCASLKAVPSNIKFALINYIGLSKRGMTKNSNEDRRNGAFFRREFYELTADKIVEDKETKALLIRAILNLPDCEQGFINDYFYFDMTLKQIAEENDCSFQWVSIVIKNILEKLRKEIDGK